MNDEWMNLIIQISKIFQWVKVYFKNSELGYLKWKILILFYIYIFPNVHFGNIWNKNIRCHCKCRHHLFVTLLIPGCHVSTDCTQNHFYVIFLTFPGDFPYFFYDIRNKNEFKIKFIVFFYCPLQENAEKLIIEVFCLKIFHFI